MAKRVRVSSTVESGLHGIGAAAGHRTGARIGLIALALLICGGVSSDLRGAAPVAAPIERVKTGTGFFATAGGLLVTGAHVVSGCPGLVVVDERGVRRSGEVLAANERLDIALIATHGDSPDYVAPLQGIVPRAGEAVVTQGFGVIPDEPSRAVLAHGTFVGTDTTPSNDPVLVVRAKFHEGMSGGAVLDRFGSLLGMVLGFYTDQPELGVVLPKDRIEWFLQANDVVLPPHELAIAPKRPTEVLKLITSLIQCVPPRPSSSK